MPLVDRQGKVLKKLICYGTMLTWLCSIVRDQANKTLDIYLQRVRRYGATLPDTVLLAAGSNDTGISSAPRMGTPQNDTSWAGWAISSFTNKIASARGEIQPVVSNVGTPSEGPGGRAKSVVPGSDTQHPIPSLATASKLHRKAMDTSVPSTTTHPPPATTPMTTAAIAAPDYFDDNAIVDEEMDAWAAMEDYEEFPEEKPADSTASFVAYDDSGEPDFAGWLAAQAQSKAKNQLPKGLTKKSETSSNNLDAASKATAAGSMKLPLKQDLTSQPTDNDPKVISMKTVDTKPKGDNWGEDDGWGASWD